MILQTDPKAAYLAQKDAIDAAISRVLDSGWYILGQEVKAFEQAFAAFTGAGAAIGVANGTDALMLALRALGLRPGDGVVTVSHTAVATVAAIDLAGATPILVDIDPSTYTMDIAALGAVLANPPCPIKAVIPVHLYGQPAAMAEIGSLAAKYQIAVIEDCSQAHGAMLDNKPVGSFGVLAAYSLYPTKNLGAIGDGGIVTTSDDRLAEQVRALREYGWRQRYISDDQGCNSRLDELQAAILRAKLTTLAADNERRRALAAFYDRALAGLPFGLPRSRAGARHVYHQYVLRCRRRDRVREFLQQAAVGTNIHYPMPIHLQPAYAGRILLGPTGMAASEQAAREVLSLPIYPQLAEADAAKVVAALRAAAEAGLD